MPTPNRVFSAIGTSTRVFAMHEQVDLENDLVDELRLNGTV
jgi:hypothetical protein